MINDTVKSITCPFVTRFIHFGDASSLTLQSDALWLWLCFSFMPYSCFNLILKLYGFILSHCMFLIHGSISVPIPYTFTYTAFHTVVCTSNLQHVPIIFNLTLSTTHSLLWSVVSVLVFSKLKKCDVSCLMIELGLIKLGRCEIMKSSLAPPSCRCIQATPNCSIHRIMIHIFFLKIIFQDFSWTVSEVVMPWLCTVVLCISRACMHTSTVYRLRLR